MSPSRPSSARCRARSTRTSRKSRRSCARRRRRARPSSCRRSSSRARTSARRRRTSSSRGRSPRRGTPRSPVSRSSRRSSTSPCRVSFFERAGHAYYNSLAMIDADGTVMGIYRKSHIPDGPGYEEKFYFRPGDTGFKAWRTRPAALGVGICWDQWFPEAARAMLLAGADVLLYPTAIGSEPENPFLDTRDLWQRAMLGHAVSNVAPVVAANRVGNENGQVFYGSSFIANQRGEKLAELSRDEEGVAVATVDLAAVRRERASWGFFRDRRPDLYGVLTT